VKERNRQLGIAAALVVVAAMWGGTFVTVQSAVERYPLYGFLGWRFAVATVAFVALFPSSVRTLDRRTWEVGLLAGAFLTAGYVFQTWGLEATSASKAAFITGMFVVITPMLQAIVLRRAPGVWTLAGVALAVAGLWFLSGGFLGGWNAGDTRVLICAFAYSAHMIVLGGPGRRLDVLPLTFVQLATVAVVTGVVSGVAERPPFPTDALVLAAIGFTGIFASAVAFAVQTYAQQHISPAKTALILITEPAFGGVFGWLAGERLGFGGLAGAALILGGMLISEVLVARIGTGGEIAIEPSLEGPPVPLPEDGAGGT
jgi:drug/metabolite transporter (DMT)-like permease